MSYPINVRIISKSETEKLVTPAEVIEVVDETFQALGNGKIFHPVKEPIWMGKENANMLIAMPAHIKDKKIVGMKWVNMFTYQQEAIPSSYGNLLLLNHEENGQPYAIIEATAITSMRTAGGHAVKNVFEATLNSPNTSIHLAGSILGIAKMESMEDFRLYRDGITPSVVATIAAVEEEKALVMKKMDYTMGRAVGQMEAILEHEKHPELNIFIGLEGPSGVKHRYITEDAYVSNSLLLSIAKEFGIRTPIYEGLVAIASAVNHTDFYETGRTLRYFGLTGKKAEEINRYLETGEK